MFVANATVTAAPAWATMRFETSDAEKLPALVPLRVALPGGQREHASPHGVAEHEVALIVERQQPTDPVQDRDNRPARRQGRALPRRRDTPSGSRGRSA